MSDETFYLKRIAPRPYEDGDAEAFGIYMLGFVNPGMKDDWGQCIGCVFTDPVEQEQRPDKPYSVWVKVLTAKGPGPFMEWQGRAFMFCTKEEIPDMTQWLYNWALLGGYKERQ